MEKIVRSQRHLFPLQGFLLVLYGVFKVEVGCMSRILYLVHHFEAFLCEFGRGQSCILQISHPQLPDWEDLITAAQNSFGAWEILIGLSEVLKALMLIGAYLERFFWLIGACLVHERRRFTVSQIRGLVHQKVGIGTRTPRVIFDFLVQNFGCPNVSILNNIFKDLLKDLIMLFNFVNSLNVSHVFEFLYGTLWIQRWEFKLPLMLIDRDHVLVLGYWTLILVYLLWGR